MISSEILGTIAAALYIIPAGLILKPILRGSVTKRKGLVLLLVGIGWMIHAWQLLDHIVGSNGLNLNLANALSLISWIMILFFVAISIKHPTESLGTVVLPIAALTVFSTGILEQTESTVDPQIQIHIFLSVAAYGVLGLGAIQTIFTAIQSQHLHNHKPGGFIKALPPLRLMENMMFTMLGSGFVLLTLSLVSGFIFLDNMLAQQLAHKTLLSVVAWGLFAILLHGHWRYGWRGKKALKWTLTAFALLALAYFGSKFVLEVLITQDSV